MGRAILRIDAVSLAGPHALMLRFNDGATRRVDLEPYLTGPVFEPLKDPEYFSRVVLDPAAVTKSGASRSEWNLAPQRPIVP